jgi:hypothetical protein
MSLIKQECIEYEDKRSVLIAEEKGKKYRLVNESGYIISKMKVDNCIIKEGQRKCDYLFSTSDKIKKVVFVELKGGSLVHAVRQISETIKHLNEDFNGFITDARIVGSRSVPNIKQTREYIALYDVVQKTKGSLIVATNKFYEESI